MYSKCLWFLKSHINGLWVGYDYDRYYNITFRVISPTHDEKNYLFVTVERILIKNVSEKLVQHGIHCLPCSYTNAVDLLP